MFGVLPPTLPFRSQMYPANCTFFVKLYFDLLFYSDVLLVARLPLQFLYCIRDLYRVAVAKGVSTEMAKNSFHRIAATTKWHKAINGCSWVAV